MTSCNKGIAHCMVSLNTVKAFSPSLVCAFTGEYSEGK